MTSLEICVSEVGILLKYGGNWIEQDNCLVYKGRKAKAVYVPKNIGFLELLQQIYQILELNYELELAYTIAEMDNTYVEVKNDHDVRYFMEYCCVQKLVPTQLCIALKEGILEIGINDNTPNEGRNPPIEVTPPNEDRSYVNPQQGNEIANIGLEFGQIYESKDDLKRKVSRLAITETFAFKVKRSTTKMIKITCLENSCDWCIRANQINKTPFFCVTKLMKNHSCNSQAQTKNDRHATSMFIADSIKDIYENVKRDYSPQDIIDDIYNHYGVRVSYMKAWRAQSFALDKARGSAEDGYSMLLSYFHMLEKSNPGTITNLVTDDLNHFVYAFMSLGATLRGFKMSIRPVIVVDGTFLKAKYKGTLLVAAAKDGNNQTYPIAFGVVNSENDDSWTWFFKNLHVAIGDVVGLVIVSDRHASIAKSIKSVMPLAAHVVCRNHLAENLKKHCKKQAARILFQKAANAYQESEYENYYSQLKNFMKPEVVSMLENEIGKEKWARSQCIHTRYNIMTTNIVEGLNANFVKARSLPIVRLFEEIRRTLQQWYDERRTQADLMKNEVTTWVDTLLHDQYQKAKFYHATKINNMEFTVTHNDMVEKVNLMDKTCTCRVFDLEQLPCSHALAVCRKFGFSWYDFCSNYFHSELLRLSYIESIYPPLDERDFNVPNEIQDKKVLPPITRTRIGRRKKKRIHAYGERKKRDQHCSSCGQIGHNRKRCRNPNPSAGE